MTFDELKKNLDINNCYRIGYLQKAHATKGQINSMLFVDFEDFEEPLFIEIDKYMVPFFVDYEMCNFDINPSIIKFKEINTIHEANTLKNKTIYLPKYLFENIEEYITDWENFVVGFKLIDTNRGNIGKILHFIESKKNPIFVIEHKNRELLVPLNSIEIFQTDYNKMTLEIKIPDIIFQF